MRVELKCLAARPMASVRLVLLPYAGAGASIYIHLAKALPGFIEPYGVQLPARETRLNEAPFENWHALTQSGADAIASLPKSPIAIFGHSFGATLALELARAITGDSAHPLVHLGCAARTWPGGEAGRQKFDAEWSDESLVTAVEKNFGASPPSFRNPEIRSAALVALRADLALLSKHQWRAAPPLTCPLTVYAGKDDPATKAKDLSAWSQETQGDLDIVSVPSGHYFIDTHADLLAADLSRKLTPPAAR